MTVSYPLAISTLGTEEIEATKAVLESGCFTMGERVSAFEREFAAWTGARHGLMVNSGSSANLLIADVLIRRAREAAHLNPGDEVLVPALTWPTTVWPLAQLGLVPVFVDVDPVTLAIDLNSAEENLGPRTRAMFLVHVLGQTARTPEYRRFCEKQGLVLIEDACEALGGHYEGRHAGTVGLMGSFSFYFSHHVCTIEGGMVVTNDSAIYDDLQSLRAHGWVRQRSDKALWVQQYSDFDERFLFVTGGYNVRPNEIQATLGSIQLAKLDQMLEAREQLAQKVSRWVEKSVPWLRLIGSERLQPQGSKQNRCARTHSWMTLPFMLGEKAPLSLKTVKQKLEAMNIETRPIIAGNLVRHPAVQLFKTRRAPSLKCCDELFERGFMIGCHPVVEPAALERLEQALLSLAN